MKVKVHYLAPSEGTKTLLEQSGERQSHSTAITRGSILFIKQKFRTAQLF